MFSDHLQKIDHTSGKKLLLLAAGLVIVCQLVAMVLVAQGQVEKAQTREVNQANVRAATASCVETRRGDTLRDCDSSSQSSAAQASQAFANPTSQQIKLVTLNRSY